VPLTYRPLAIRVNGDCVNLRIPGVYVLKFECMDPDTNMMAAPRTRTVVIKDVECPFLTMKGDSVVRLEAGFPYHDEGVDAHDEVDGDLGSRVITRGDTVDSRKAFTSFSSCAEILRERQKAGEPAHSGEYVISGMKTSQPSAAGVSKTKIMRIKVS
jgi:hypothetical protein